MTLKQLIKALDIRHNQYSLADFQVRGITCNSKQVLPNFIFVAVKGNREDGNRYIGEAIDRGAKLIITNNSKKAGFLAVKDTRKALAKLAARFYGDPSRKIKVVGITGTNGKTTVSYLIEALLKELGRKAAVIGTINYRFKDKIIPSKNTTPGPIELQSMLADMLKEKIRYAVMEVSSHALDQERTGEINFHSAIFTNLTQDHLDYHKTKEKYFQAKAKLFKNINSGSSAIINNDDSYAVRLKKLTRARLITYGIENKSDILAEDIRFDCAHTEFSLLCFKERISVRSQLIGRYNVYNILAMVAWARSQGIGLAAVKSLIEKFSYVPGRLERIMSDKDFSIFVDYAHTEDALKNIIQTLRHASRRRLIVVFGCGGERDKTKRPKMGRVVSELSDYAIITNDNPRSEDPRRIISDIKRGIRKNNYCVIPQRLEAIRKSLFLAKPGDIVLVAGKGHENYQILKDKTLDFDDREAIRECLKSMN